MAAVFLKLLNLSISASWLVLAVLVLAVLFLLYSCAVQRLIYSSRGTMIFLPERPLI